MDCGCNDEDGHPVNMYMMVTPPVCCSWVMPTVQLLYKHYILESGQGVTALLDDTSLASSPYSTMANYCSIDHKTIGHHYEYEHRDSNLATPSPNVVDQDNGGVS